MTLSSVHPTSLPITPKLIPVFLVNLKISPDPEQIYSDKSKDLSLATVVHGSITPVDNELNLTFSLSSIKGFDDLTNISGTTFLDCKLYGKLADSNSDSGVYFTYPGILNLNQPTIDVFTKVSTTSSFEDSYITCSPKFSFNTATVPEKYHWVLKEKFHGKGRFVRDEEGALYVQYYTYVYR